MLTWRAGLHGGSSPQGHRGRGEKQKEVCGVNVGGGEAASSIARSSAQEARFSTSPDLTPAGRPRAWPAGPRGPGMAH